MQTATQSIAREYEPESVRKEREKSEQETAAQKKAINAKGKALLDDPVAREFIAECCLSMGYVGGWAGRVDDFNQGVLYAAHMIVKNLGEDNKPRMLRILADRAIAKTIKRRKQ